jgi:hypothetical protein
MENTVITAVEPTDHARPIGDLTRFFRWDGERREYVMNSQIDPQIDTESWVSSPSPVRDRIISPNHNPTVGEIVHALNSAVVREVRANARVDEVRQQAHDAIRIIGERLLQEADRRGWCDEFDQIIDEVNGELPGPYELPIREKEYEVTWTETFTVTVHRSATYTAKSAEDAEEMAQEEDIDSSDLIDAIRNGNWESDYGDNDYEVQEV